MGRNFGARVATAPDMLLESQNRNSMSNKTAWEKAAAAQGTTDSERALARLARKAFLSLWSYPNVYSDEGKTGGKGDGKEKADQQEDKDTDEQQISDKH